MKRRAYDPELYELLGVMAENVVKALEATEQRVEHCSAAACILQRQYHKIKRARAKVRRQSAAQ